MKEIELTLNQTELNMVLNSLAQLPYAQVNELMQKLAAQIGSQLAAPPQPGEVQLTEVAG